MDATIKEGNVGRNFSPVDKLKINLQNDGGESLWVPEDSVQLDELYTSTNGTYYAAPRDIYGWGVVTVDVDNSIDEPDDLYDDDEDQDDEPGGDDDDEDQGDDSWDDWDDEPDEDWDEDGDEGDEEDEDEDDWEDDDWGDEDDDWGDDDEEWDDDGITDGDDYNYIDDDGNIVEEECPASIKVVFPPNKTEYTDGDSIDLTGLYVYAYNEDGSVFRGGKYRDGRVPNNELSLSQSRSEYDGGTTSYDFPESESANGNITVAPISAAFEGAMTDVYDVIADLDIKAEEADEEAGSQMHTGSFLDSLKDSVSNIISGSGISQGDVYSIIIDKGQFERIIPRSSGFGTVAPVLIIRTFKNLPEVINPSNYYYFTSVSYLIKWSVSGYLGFVNPKYSSGTSLLSQGIMNDGNQIIASNINMVEGTKRTNEVDIQWLSPCGIEPLTTSFDISVLPSGVNTGTTISGNHGGSHYSGKF